jgi:hypothetical protein
VGDLWGAEERRAWGRRAYPRASTSSPPNVFEPDERSE